MSDTHDDLGDNSRSLAIVWVSGMSPLGVTSGLAMYTSGLTEALAACGHVVSCIALGSPVGDPRRRANWNLIAAQPRGRLRALFSSLPYIASRLDVAEHREAVEDALSPDVDVVVIDHLMSGWCLKAVLAWRERSGGVIVHVSHNHEGHVRTLWARGTSKLSAQGVYLRFDAFRIRRLERRLCRNVDLVTTTTLDDRRAFADTVDFDRSLVLTPGWTPREEPDSPEAETHRSPDQPIPERPRQVALLGSFDWEAKRQNLTAVVSAFDGPFARAGIKFLIVGSGDEDFLERQRGRWLTTEFLGHVADADEVLNTCRIGVVAEPIGGGFKLKALDYGFGGLPMAILDGSVAGIDLQAGKDVIVAPTLESLADEIVGAVDDTDRLVCLAHSARERLDGRHDWRDRGETLSTRLVAAAMSTGVAS